MSCCCWDSVVQMHNSGGQMSLLAKRVHLVKKVSVSFGSWADVFLLLTLTTTAAVLTLTF